jgi:hypothetical protein
VGEYLEDKASLWLVETIIGRLNKLEETIASGDFAKKKKNADSDSNLSELNEEEDEGSASE